MAYSMILMVLRYLACAVVSVASSIFVWATCWFWAALSFTTRDGNLPRWCCWLQTHDAPLDELWIKGRQYINVGNYAWLNTWRNQLMRGSFEPFVPTTMFKYCARVCWLIRNPAYGVANAMGVDKAVLIELRHTKNGNREFWLYQTPDGRYFFTLVWRGRCKYGYKSVGDWPRLMVATSNPFKK